MARATGEELVRRAPAARLRVVPPRPFLLVHPSFYALIGLRGHVDYRRTETMVEAHTPGISRSPES